jgi:hypothetical protein
MRASMHATAKPHFNTREARVCACTYRRRVSSRARWTARRPARGARRRSAGCARGSRRVPTGGLSNVIYTARSRLLYGKRRLPEERESASRRAWARGRARAVVRVPRAFCQRIFLGKVPDGVRASQARGPSARAGTRRLSFMTVGVDVRSRVGARVYIVKLGAHNHNPVPTYPCLVATTG